jgi:hypothetical protein
VNIVIQFTKKTGDYSALSHADICVLALTYALDKADKSEREKRPRPGVDEVCTWSFLVDRYFFTNEF